VTVAIKRATFKHIEAELYAFPDTKKEIAKLREEIMYGSTDEDENVGAGKNSYRTPGRPTERIATRLMTDKRLRNLEEIVDAVESVYKNLDHNQRELLKMRYWSGRNNKSWERIALELEISERSVYNYRKAIITSVAGKVGWR
jgi:RinA family phage transcriptional activator